MTVTQPEVIERNVEKTNVWLKDLAAELGTDDRRYAYRVLRAFFHVLRDRLTVDESAQLAAQLPELLRGVYYEGWRPSHTPPACRRVQYQGGARGAAGRDHGGVVCRQRRDDRASTSRLRRGDRGRARHPAGRHPPAAQRVGDDPAPGSLLDRQDSDRAACLVDDDRVAAALEGGRFQHLEHPAVPDHETLGVCARDPLRRLRRAGARGRARRQPVAARRVRPAVAAVALLPVPEAHVRVDRRRAAVPHRGRPPGLARRAARRCWR